ncbi:hypothetical protein [Candidatus Vampirococcus lugosii]|uniref:Uncharacterized protein n=1 Tax=Candidatus Vampirococcus lugosii TaxID=2789015 RepID=A0ABS5QKS1_9BACT|nr:hypothetical protein [Candidatus Vampirococcus lugosii]MBS8121709.1 hypothetical protein [Candidatus Vampirococcus lugosii]
MSIYNKKYFFVSVGLLLLLILAFLIFPLKQKEKLSFEYDIDKIDSNFIKKELMDNGCYDKIENVDMNYESLQKFVIKCNEVYSGAYIKLDKNCSNFDRPSDTKRCKDWEMYDDLSRFLIYDYMHFDNENLKISLEHNGCAGENLKLDDIYDANNCNRIYESDLYTSQAIDESNYEICNEIEDKVNSEFCISRYWIEHAKNIEDCKNIIHNNLKGVCQDKFKEK